MQRPSEMPLCCGNETVFVDNVPGKEYVYCRTCKHEVGEDGGCKSCVLSRYPSFLKEARTGREAQDAMDAIHYKLANQPVLTPRKGLAGISPFHFVGGVPTPVPLPTRVFPNTGRVSGGHMVNLTTNVCAECGMTKDEALAGAAKTGAIPSCQGPAAMARRKDGAGSYKTHNWDHSASFAHVDCKDCAANTAMFSYISGEGPMCAAALRAPTGPVVAPQQPTPVNGYAVHSHSLDLNGSCTRHGCSATAAELKRGTVSPHCVGAAP